MNREPSPKRPFCLLGGAIIRDPSKLFLLTCFLLRLVSYYSVLSLPDRPLSFRSMKSGPRDCKSHTNHGPSESIPSKKKRRTQE
ncbi:hypothetical protein OUZ56_007655 [Daphnia magna]|uniref:Uncharacterized protein n=1 Tax=Daphnia magna TaxID=35525 RepID=A0ABR0AAK3_9CRUS|nr:hypothetical protein OUZ56_007655 [Daphnia magna]